MPRWNSFLSFLGEAQQVLASERQALVDELLRERLEWPWVEKNQATFIYVSLGTKRVAINMDVIKGDPPFADMTRLEGTTLWYVNRQFERDDLLDYLMAVDDPMTPLAQERDITSRIARFWRTDPLNPVKMVTAQQNVSVLRMQDARPFPDWSKFVHVPHGKIYEHNVNSNQLRFSGRKVWVYTPVEYDENPRKQYPVLFLQDGQWSVGPLQVPYIADSLIKHTQMQPVIIVMVQSGDQKDRIKTYVSNDSHYLFILTELLFFLQGHYRIDASNMGIGGVAVGAIAAAHAALKNPAVFTHLIMISPPLGKGIAQDQLKQYMGRFENASILPKRIFQSVGRYETRSRFYLPAQILQSILSRRTDTDYKYVEIGSGHGLVGFRSILPEALAWAYPVYG